MEQYFNILPTPKALQGMEQKHNASGAHVVTNVELYTTDIISVLERCSLISGPGRFWNMGLLIVMDSASCSLTK